MDDEPPELPWAGLVMVLAGSVLLAAKGIFAKALYARGLDFETVVTVRAVIAIPGFLLVGWITGGFNGLRNATAKDFLLAAFAGFVCYTLGAYANFYALTLIDAGVERALLFGYPALVVIAVAVLQKALPGPWTTGAVIGTYLGIALVVGAFDADLLRQNFTGAMWVMFCSATIAYYFLVSGRLTHTMGSAGFTLVAMVVAGIGLGTQYQFTTGWQSVSVDSTSLWILIIMAVFVTVLPLYLVAEGVRRIGAARAAIASTVGPPATVVFAAFVLNERMSVAQFVGMALIVLSILLLELRRRS